MQNIVDVLITILTKDEEKTYLMQLNQAIPVS